MKFKKIFAEVMSDKKIKIGIGLVVVVLLIIFSMEPAEETPVEYSSTKQQEDVIDLTAPAMYPKYPIVDPLEYGIYGPVVKDFLDFHDYPYYEPLVDIVYHAMERYFIRSIITQYEVNESMIYHVTKGDSLRYVQGDTTLRIQLANELIEMK